MQWRVLPALPQKIFIPIVAVVIVGIMQLYKRPNLDAIPSIGPSSWLGSWWTVIRLMINAEEVIQQGYRKYKGALFKIPTIYRWVVIVSSRAHIEELGGARDDELSFQEPVFDDLNLKYTIGSEIIHNPHQITITRSQLTRNIGVLFPELRDEVVTAFEEILDLKDNEWKSVPALNLNHQVVCRASNRAFVGLPLCQDSDFVALNIQYTIDIVAGGLLLGFFPKILRPLAARFITNIPNSIRRGTRHLGPIIEERRRLLKEHGMDWTEKPRDLVSWLMDEMGVDATVESMTNYILATNFAAIHTSAEVVTNALYNLAANPQYLEPIREEIEAIVEKEGWSKASLGKMHKIDSSLRESMRMDPIGVWSLTRQTKKDFILSEGTLIPKGTRMSVAFREIHYDDALYENPKEFDAFRFVNMDSEGRESAKYQFVTTAPDYLGFGHGRHACPGRHFAAVMLKTMLAQIIMTYDIKLEENMSRPRNMLVGASIIANPTARVMFRKRARQDGKHLI